MRSCTFGKKQRRNSKTKSTIVIAEVIIISLKVEISKAIKR